MKISTASRKQLLDLQRPLPVDLQHHVVTLRRPGCRWPCEVPYRLPWTSAHSMKVASGDHRAEFGLVDEVVLAALLLLTSWRRVVCDTDTPRWESSLQQRLDQTRFARSAGRCDHEKTACLLHG
jgi:hypothetical protein